MSGDTTLLQRTRNIADKHKGKVSTAAGGGLSLVLAYQLFVTSDHFNQHRQDEKDARAAQWRHMMDLENKLDAVRMEVAHFHPSATNHP
jgi:hypothetical protein